MKNLKVGNTVLLSLGLASQVEWRAALSNVCIQVPTSYLEKGFPSCLLQCLMKAALDSCNYYWNKRIYTRRTNLKCFIFLNVKKPLFLTNILFLSTLILYFAIRKCVYFFILKIRFHLYLKSLGKVRNKPTMMEDASFFSLLPPSPWPYPNANCCFNYGDLEMYSDHRLCRSTLIYLF